MKVCFFGLGLFLVLVKRNISMPEQSKINSTSVRAWFDYRTKIANITNLDELIRYLNS